MTKLSTALTGALVFAACGCVHAADVTIYGSLDTGFRYAVNDDIDGVKSSDTAAMQTGQYFPNMVAIKGEETLNNGLRIGLSLENRFNSDSGTLSENGRLFDNQALVMIHGEKWTLAAGRMEGLSSTMGEFDLMCPMDPFEGGWAEAGGANMFANIGLSANNAVAARFRDGGLTLAGAYSLSLADKEADTYGDNQHYGALGAVWKNDALWVGATYETITRGSVAQKQNRVVKAGVNYDFGPARAFLGYSYTKDHAWYGVTTDSHSYMLGATVPLAGGTVRTSLQWFDGDTTTVDGQDFTPERWVASLGYTYSLSPRTILWGVASYSQGRKSLDKDAVNGLAMADTKDRQESNRTLLNLGMTHFF